MRIEQEIRQLDPSLQGTHSELEKAIAQTFQKVRRRLSLLEAAAIYRGITASQASHLLQGMSDRVWNIDHKNEITYFVDSGGTRFTADELEAMALQLRATINT